MALLDKAKSVCRVTSTAFDDEILDLISAGLLDLGISDISESLLMDSENLDPLILKAVLTYVRKEFGTLDDGLYNRLDRSYKEQKAQLISSTGYGLGGDSCV